MKKIILTPGPTPVDPLIYPVLKEKIDHHRTKEFSLVLKNIQKKLQSLFETKNPVCILSASGTGAMEASISNALSPLDTVICIEAGKFGQRWADIAKAYKLNVISLKVSEKKDFDEKKLIKLLKKYPQTKAVLMQHCETSSAYLLDVKKIAQLIPKYSKALIMVDAMTSIGAMDFFMDKWALDVVITGSQKACMSPTGISLMSFSKKALKASLEAKCPRYYFDIHKYLKALKKNQTPFSSPTVLIKALNQSLDQFYPRNRKLRRIKHVKSLQKACLKILEILNLKTLSFKTSPSVTAIKLPSKICGIKLKNGLNEKYQISLGGGQEHLEGKIIRIGHMGYTRHKELFLAFKAIIELSNKMSKDTFKPQQIQKFNIEAKKYLKKEKYSDF